ncbi:MAG: DM13 domain-containing protein [Nanoarchaeota archaeon]
MATDTNGEDYIDLGELKATKGNINYEIPEDIDFEKYDKVLIWCVPFKVLFGYAKLK